MISTSHLIAVIVAAASLVSAAATDAAPTTNSQSTTSKTTSLKSTAAMRQGTSAGVNHHGPRRPIVMGASIDLKCGGTTYSVSTGNNSGECQTGSTGQNATCTDGNGNSTEASCASGCMNAKGSGSCKAKQ